MTVEQSNRDARLTSASQPIALAATSHNRSVLSTAESAVTSAPDDTAAESDAASSNVAFPGSPASRLSWWRWRSAALFVGLDLYAIMLAWLLVPVGPVPLTLISVSVVAVAVGQRMDMYRSRLELSVLDDVPALLFVAVAGCATALAVAAAHGIPAPNFGLCFLFGVVELGALICCRAAIYTVGRAMRRNRSVTHPVIVVGAGDIGERLADAMLSHPEYGLAPIGFVDSDPQSRFRPLPLPVLGGLGALPRAMLEHDVNDVVFAFSGAPDAQLVSAVRACVRLDCQVFVVPRFFELYGADRRSHVEVIWGVPLVRLRRWPLRLMGTTLKRGTDITLAALGLAVLSPLMLACAIAVRLEGGKGVIFKQARIGRDNKTFTLYKFRSMRPVDDSDGAPTWSIDGDRRIGPVGRFLRRTGLDELPQLVNILRGDMSIVGPRPERPHFAKTFGEAVRQYSARHRVPVGLTGLAQVNGLRGDTSITERVTFDNYYIDNWSFWSDIKIIIRTGSTFFRRGSEPAPEVAEVVELSSVSTGSHRH